MDQDPFVEEFEDLWGEELSSSARREMPSIEGLEAPVSPPAWRQLGVFVLDGSVSMTWEYDDGADAISLGPQTKATVVSTVVRELVNVLDVSRRRFHFAVGSVFFHETVAHEEPPCTVDQIPGSKSFDPTQHGTGGTSVGSGIDAAARMVSSFYSDEADLGVPLSAVVLVLSDGECSNPQGTIDAAKRLRELPNVVVASCYFATKGEGASAGPRLLQAVSSDPARYYQTVFNGAQLRDFFMASITNAVNDLMV